MDCDDYESLYADSGITDFLKILIAVGALEGAALGVARQYMDQGFESLTMKQLEVFHRYVITPFRTQYCQRCGGDIVWSEMYDAYENGGLCAYCNYKMTEAD